MSEHAPDHSRLLIRVEGRVQGVNFRASARRMARELAIEADPANLHDGAVQIEVDGPREAVDRFVAWCQEGPPMAQVTAVTVTELS